MGTVTGIAWADSTFNPWIGCTKVGPGCDHCYASVSTPARSLGVKWGAGEARHRTSAANWRKPLAWNAEAERTGVCRRVFCASLADVFDNKAPREWREDLFRLIEQTQNLIWMLLTKRIGNAADMMFEARGGHLPLLENVWLGATIVNQEEADRDIPKLLETPAAKRFVSCEPLLAAVDLTPFMWGKNTLIESICQECPRDADCECGYMTRRELKLSALDWVIVGGESNQPGMRARPFDVRWARETVGQCRGAGVPVFVKQLGSTPVLDCGEEDIFSAARLSHRRWHDPEGTPHRRQEIAFQCRAGADPSEWPEDLRVQEFPNER